MPQMLWLPKWWFQEQLYKLMERKASYSNKKLGEKKVKIAGFESTDAADTWKQRGYLRRSMPCL